MEKDDHFNQLIGELPKWNNGAGIEPEAWISCMGNYELAIGYSRVFWPRFERIGHCIVRANIGPYALKSLPDCPAEDASRTEAMVNHLHVLDLHGNVEIPPSELQLRYLGRTLKEIWETKLRIDFPDLRFAVEFNDEPGLPLIDYQLTFWHIESSAVA